MNPNVVPNFSHRSPEFNALFIDTQYRLLHFAGLDYQKDMALFVTGSGTLANEIVMSSMSQQPYINTKGEFSRRLTETRDLYWHGDDNVSRLNFGVQFETADCEFVTCDNNFAVDCVSAFPFYPLPAKARIMTTVSSKQLGAETGLSIIFIRDYRELLTTGFIDGAKRSYLSLSRYIQYALKNETPNTPAIGLIQSLNDRLKVFKIEAERERISGYWRRIQDALQARQLYASMSHGAPKPVITFRGINELFTDLGLYSNSGNPQLFLWSADDELIDTVVKRIMDYQPPEEKGYVGASLLGIINKNKGDDE